jgi:hypothetical protein
MSLSKIVRLPEYVDGRPFTVLKTWRKSPEATNKLSGGTRHHKTSVDAPIKAKEKSFFSFFSFLARFITSVAGVFPHLWLLSIKIR